MGDFGIMLINNLIFFILRWYILVKCINLVFWLEVYKCLMWMGLRFWCIFLSEVLIWLWLYFVLICYVWVYLFIRMGCLCFIVLLYIMMSKWFILWVKVIYFIDFCFLKMLNLLFLMMFCLLNWSGYLLWFGLLIWRCWKLILKRWRRFSLRRIDLVSVCYVGW